MSTHGATYLTRSPEETQALAQKIARKLPLGSLVCLFGSMGSGKTVFVRGLAKGLKLPGHVQSPTFTLIREYGSPKGTMYHMDLFRLQAKDISSLGLEEFLAPRKGWTVIEWPERIRRLLPYERLDIRLKIIDSRSREIRVDKSTRIRSPHG